MLTLGVPKIPSNEELINDPKNILKHKLYLDSGTIFETYNVSKLLDFKSNQFLLILNSELYILPQNVQILKL
jgi:hypothetical protein